MFFDQTKKVLCVLLISGIMEKNNQEQFDLNDDAIKNMDPKLLMKILFETHREFTLRDPIIYNVVQISHSKCWIRAFEKFQQMQKTTSEQLDEQISNETNSTCVDEEKTNMVVDEEKNNK